MRQILIIWDYHKTQKYVLDKAIALARPFGAKISLAVFGVQQSGTGADKEAVKQAKGAINTMIADAIAHQSLTDLKIDHEFVTGEDITEWTLQTTSSRGFDLVVKAGDHSKAIFHTSTDWKLIRQLQCPLLICSTRKWKSKPCILATVDAAARNELQQTINRKVLDMAQQLAAGDHSALHAAYTIPIARALDALVITEPPEVMRKKGAAAIRKLQAILEAQGIRADGIHVAAGNPVDEISRVANKIKAQLVIMGSVGRKGVRGVLLGNTAEAILKNLRTDVLIIKP